MNLQHISPKSSLSRLSLYIKQKSLKVMILGQSGVGKTALIVRFITKRYIGDYDRNMEKIYSFTTTMDNESVHFDILDAVTELPESEGSNLESNIRWADAFILMYSVTDKCSFDECNRLKFLINYNKRRRKLGSNSRDYAFEVPVVLVGNKTDQIGDRMISVKDGQHCFKQLSCVCFHEISVRESLDQVQAVFRDLFRFWHVFSKFPKMKRSTSDVPNINDFILSPDSDCSFYDFNPLMLQNKISLRITGSACLEEKDYSNTVLANYSHCHSSAGQQELVATPFRSRASTEGILLARPRRWRYPPPGYLLTQSNRVDRRMSISSRGTNFSY